VQAINANGAPLTLALPLAEFAKAYDGPPTDPKVFEETRRSCRKNCRSARRKPARSWKTRLRPPIPPRSNAVFVKSEGRAAMRAFLFCAEQNALCYYRDAAQTGRDIQRFCARRHRVMSDYSALAA
jgi:hypothetical protein